jgi:hypothetical protein
MGRDEKRASSQTKSIFGLQISQRLKNEGTGALIEPRNMNQRHMALAE